MEQLVLLLLLIPVKAHPLSLPPDRKRMGMSVGTVLAGPWSIQIKWLTNQWCGFVVGLLFWKVCQYILTFLRKHISNSTSYLLFNSNQIFLTMNPPLLYNNNRGVKGSVCSIDGGFQCMPTDMKGCTQQDKHIYHSLFAASNHRLRPLYVFE